ncbi:MAG TPA: NADPH:quinone reductase [Micromonosporaceae bacterium]|nr:NADPH:quinone reductase [Micromonosporaceae bacterium]
MAVEPRSEQMTAAFITGFGPPDAIRVGPLPVPAPGPTDVLVRVEAVAVNHVDTFIRSGAYRTGVTFPFVIGRDLVGTVAQPGSAVTTFRPGQRVWCNSLGHDGRQGSFAGYAVAPADRLYPLPDGVDPVNAVSTLHTAATAYIGLFRTARVAEGETVVVGQGGGVADAAVQLAAAAGARVIAVDRAGNAGWCRACGASEVLDRDDAALAKNLAELAPGGVDVFWDSSGRHDLEATVPLMARGGRILLSAGLGSRTVLPVGPFYTRDLTINGFVISNASVHDLAEAAETINRELAAGRLRGRVRVQLPLAAAAEAHRLQETRDPGAPPGRVVLTPAKL